jgi:hypothetical protein
MLQVEHGFPIHGTEPFSYNAADRIWHNHEWLAQRWFYRVFATAPEGDLQGGLFRLILFKSVIVAATFVLVCWAVAQRGAGWATAALCAVVAAEVSRRTIYVRPPIFSYLFMAGFLAMLHQWKAGRLCGRWLWALPPMTVLWANLHGMVPLAIVCTGAYAAGEWIEALLRPGLRAPLRQRLESLVQSATVRLTTAVLLVTALATLAQPSGIGLYSLAGNFTKDPLLQRTIAEMLPTKWFLRLCHILGSAVCNCCGLDLEPWSASALGRWASHSLFCLPGRDALAIAALVRDCGHASLWVASIPASDSRAPKSVAPFHTSRSCPCRACPGSGADLHRSD